MLKEECNKYIAWCKKYYYKANTYTALKAYCKLNKSLSAGSTLS